jgi:anti-anti-sigma factor
MRGGMEAVYDDVLAPVGFARFAPVHDAPAGRNRERAPDDIEDRWAGRRAHCLGLFPPYLRKEVGIARQTATAAASAASLDVRGRHGIVTPVCQTRPMDIMEHHAGPTTVLAPRGPLRGSGCTALSHSVHRALAAGRRQIVIDLTHVSAIDAEGAGTLVQLRLETLRRGAGLRLEHARGRVLRLLKLAHLDEVMEMVTWGNDWGLSRCAQ